MPSKKPRNALVGLTEDDAETEESAEASVDVEMPTEPVTKKAKAEAETTLKNNKLSAAQRFMKSDAVKGLLKSLGDSVVCQASDARDITNKLPTGIFPLDYALAGGWPIGRIMHIYGRKSSSKTTTILRSFAKAQRSCASCWRLFKTIPPAGSGTAFCPCKDYREPVCGYMDAEGALDLEWAKTLGVDLERLILSRPPVAEEGVDVADVWLRSGEMDFIAIDSVAFLVPLKEQEKDSGAHTPGEHARLVNKLVRKMVSGSLAIQRSTGRYPTVFLLNQIREKIGVMFGCFAYDTPVTLANGDTLPIGQIVEERLAVDVLTFNPVTGAVHNRPVTGWHDNGEAASFLRFVVASVDDQDTATFAVTPNHHIFVYENDTWVEREAGLLRVGDLVGRHSMTRDAGWVMAPVGILQIHPELPNVSMRRFDLTVAEHHTYLVDGVAVHNSPEVTTGGNAPGYAATVEVKLSAKKYENDPNSGVALWVDMGFKIEKNKVAATAKMDGEYRLILADSVSKKKGHVYDEPFVIAKAQENGLITGAGSSWHCLGEHFSAKTLIEKRMFTDVDFADKLRTETMKILLFSLTGVE